MLFLKVIIHLSPLCKENSFGSIQANISPWYFVSKIQEDFEYFLIHSSGRWLHSGKFISTFPKLRGTLRPRGAAGLCILPAHPASVSARASHSQALCLPASMILLPWWKTERKNNRILSRSSLRANSDKMLFSPWFGDSRWLLLVPGEAENVKMFLKFFQLVWKPWVSGSKVVSHALAQTFLSWGTILWVTQRKRSVLM